MWYRLFRAAKYLGVAPWDLLRMGVWWREHAIAALSAENWAEDYRNSRK